MGLRLIDLPPPSAFDCLACFRPGDTPIKVYITFTGIACGTEWDNTWDPPPNRTFEVIQNVGVHNCIWDYIGLNWLANFTTVLAGPPFPGSQVGLSCAAPGFAWAFNGVIKPACRYSFENSIVNPIPNVYYGGTAWVWRL